MFNINHKQYLKKVEIDNEYYYLLENAQTITPFFMTIVSASNHWMFVWSNGALSLGRKNADYAFFPYYTDDKILFGAEHTGCKTFVKIKLENETKIWEPFSDKTLQNFDIQRNVYKSTVGNQIIFEEINTTAQLIFRYKWSNSHQFGFVRESKIINTSSRNISVEILDGFQNILPYGVGSDLQNAYSNLVNAYKSSELVENVQLGIFALSAIIVDRAEPSEALKANTVWHLGLEQPIILLSDNQIHTFLNNESVNTETQNKGNRACYFTLQDLVIAGGEQKKWFLMANVNQNHSQIASLQKALLQPEILLNKVLSDVELGTQQLVHLVAQADGIQLTNDTLKDTRHFSNVVFNIMRGGAFTENYKINKSDFLQYLLNADKKLHGKAIVVLNTLPDSIFISDFGNLKIAENPDFYRLSYEYLPLYFSRRHGDPSRPWNKFNINTFDDDTQTKILDYQGNWRDIFQNWETLSFSFPDYSVNMLFKFLNASTFDGYNPYRVTKDGFDWETIEHDNPWSYIGYWGDHQIIYLLKFLEFIQNIDSIKLPALFDKDVFVYANVPYKIKPFQSIVKDPKNTIDFDFELDKIIRKNIAEKGFDTAFLVNRQQELHRVNFIEKIVAVLLSKLSNYIPEAGIWMNTQRPEWNDANNALVGNGASMVTLYYLRRFVSFFEKIIQHSNQTDFEISSELFDFYQTTQHIFNQYHSELTNSSFTDALRYEMVEQLGEIASSYRWNIYNNGFSGNRKRLNIKNFQDFLQTILQHVDYSIAKNKRTDNLFHAYNLVSFSDKNITISNLSVMLEGQVAVLSSGFLSAKEVLNLLEELRNSELYREDVQSYMLYPIKKLKGFLEKNTFNEEQIQSSALLVELLQHNNKQIIEKDCFGRIHFNSDFKNAADLENALKNIDSNIFKESTENEFNKIKDLYEEIFQHKTFTGRSGTFYAYEGIGSVYWHMVSKLALAVQENVIKLEEENTDKVLIDLFKQKYYDITEGLGVHKSVNDYGAFTTDAYSHTPYGKGAQQPGMTGQVKEDILCRWGELGVFVRNNAVYFHPFILKLTELSKAKTNFHFYDLNGTFKTIEIPENSLAFTYCQVPVVYTLTEKTAMKIFDANNNYICFEQSQLSPELSESIWQRKNEISKIEIHFTKDLFFNPNE